ncbi:ABC-type polysaccharide/polyol phosphate export permease [Malonomonas rubra DSM 5091]|uniref:Transport permease protein n=1 Tax=Malonomonas rubra DSM 5091 TaxID=1122189 RepID=A0A1M6NL04_MALRU|nr:ABC transporter permease [Malonomonas rubra]SHJ96407.1 ABC-type polysaccharide/polyol phosphate export permease [Malonomonas rubra DSM 5091]
MLYGARAIYLREMLILRRKMIKTLMASAVSPALFLLAFGYGVGRGAQVGGVDYLAFLLPGLLTMSSMNQAYGIATEINISRFYFKVFEEFLLAPIKRWEIILGETCYGITKGFIPVLIIGLYSLLTGVTLKFGPLFLLALLLHLAIFALLGFIAAMIVKSHADQATINAFLITPMMFLSGTFFPVDQMPLAIRAVASIFPLTYSTQLIRATLTPGAELNAWLYLVLVAILAVLFFLAKRIVAKVEI